MKARTWPLGRPLLVWRNLRRHPLRSVLTGSNLAVCSLAVLGSATVLGTLDRASSAPANATTLVVQSERGFARSMPRSHLDVVRALPDVAEAYAVRAFYASGRDPNRHVVVLFVSEGGAPFVARAMSSQLPADAQAAFDADPGGLLVGAAAARANGWSVGDTIRLPLLSSGVPPLPARVVGIVPDGLLASQVVAHEELARHAGIGTNPSFVVARAVPGRHEAVQDAIDAAFRGSRAPTRTETGAALLRRFEDASAIRPLVIVATLCIAASCTLISGTSLALALRARARLVPILKAIGFDRRWIASLLLAEPLVLGAASGTLGVLGFLALARGPLVLDLHIASVFQPSASAVTLAWSLPVAIAAFSVALGIRTIVALPAAAGMRKGE